MLIEQVIDLRKVRTWNLKFRTDLLDQNMDGILWLVSNTVYDYFQQQISQKIFKLVQSVQVSTWLSDIKFTCFSLF